MTDEAEALLQVFKNLTPDDRHTLLVFAQFLEHRTGAALLAGLQRKIAVPEPAAFPEPATIPRPAEERVIAAIKRLSETYPMLNKNHMMGDTSTWLTKHVMEGLEAKEVIDELEALFLSRYEALKEQHSED